MRPDELFTINGTPFVLEADRNTERNGGESVAATRWAKKLEHYVEVIRQRTYEKEWRFKSLVVLCLFISPVKALHVREYLANTMNKKSSAIAFRGSDGLGLERYRAAAASLHS